MPPTAEAAASTADSGGGLVPNQLAMLVPTFDPAKDDLTVYSQKVALLLTSWPEGKYHELATRLILGCSGSAFNKLQIHASEVTQNDKKSIQRIVELLGGHWGQINLERQYEYVERALYRCAQKSDESADSYLARADIMWSELLSKSIDLKSIQAYVTLRGSLLSSDDKKRVILDADGAGSGTLSSTKVQAAIRMLGANFFQDMTGARRGRGKTYDQATLVADSEDVDDNATLNVNSEEYLVEEDHFEALFQDSLHEGDEDAALIQEFEAAATDLIQSDEELAMAYNAYSEARRRLSEKFRSRGFWPVTGGKNKGRGFAKGGSKGKFGKSHHSSRKSLQQRILESKCRLCGKVGHWKAECPSRPEASSSASSRSSQAPTSFVQPLHEAQTGSIDALPLEFLALPETTSTIDDAQPNLFVASVFVGIDVKGGNDKSKLRETLQKWEDCHRSLSSSPRNEVCEDSPKTRLMQRIRKTKCNVQEQCKSVGSTETALFASHSSFGVVDLGATKTVIGSSNVVDLLNHLHPKVREQVERCSCRITFRFGNHGTLQSQHALVIPFSGFRLKIAVVPGETPFLLSNTLLRAIGAVIDTDQNRMWSSKLQRDIPLHLTHKGLFLMDLNDLVVPAEVLSKPLMTEPIETHMSIDEKGLRFDKKERVSDPKIKTKGDKSKRDPNGESTEVDNQRNTETDPDRHLSPSPQSSLVQNPQIDSSASSSGSKSFPKSFRYFDRSQHGVGSTIEEPAGQGQRDTGRPVSSSAGRSSSREGPIRTEASRQELQDGVGHRSNLGHLGGATLRDINQGCPSQAHAIRGTSDRESRKLRRKDHGEGEPTRGEYQGNWEVLPSSTQDPLIKGHRAEDSLGGIRGRGGRHLRDDCSTSGAKQPRCSTPRGSHAQSGECTSTSDQPLGGASSEGPGQLECPVDAVFETLHEAGDLSSDCYLEYSPEVCKERKRFQQLVRQYQSELDSLILASGNMIPKKPIELLEVFCSSQSTLTHQCQQMGYRAVRFSPEQGDLQSREGRQLLFEMLIQGIPRNVWFSPTCGPWSGWSNLNGSQSVEAWDNLQALRLDHLKQIALGVILLRFQLSKSKHFHWEQPATSLMFRLPYLSEPFFYCQLLELDMCMAGDLRDPENGLKPIKKGLHILTTSRKFHENMQGLRCSGNHHDHQIIEGSTRYHGKVMNRSKFTELYPRKFARKVAGLLCSQGVVKEVPLGSNAVTLAATDPVLPEAKKRRLAAKPKPVRTHPIESDQPNQKRFRLGSKQTVPKSSEEWQRIFDQTELLLPRVGRRSITDPELIAKIQSLLPDKVIKQVVACKGTNRTIPPPKELAVGEAPFRRGIYLERNTGVIHIDDDWEPWENLSHRQLIRPSPACRINITILAANPAIPACPSNPMTRVNAEHSPQYPETIPQTPDVSTPSLSQAQLADLSSDHQPESFKLLSKEEQRSLVRAHRNLGHPSPDRFSAVLRQQGFRPEMVRAAMEMQCSTCQAKVEPKHARPSTIKDDLDFNDRISIDGLKWTNKSGTSFHIYHVIDWATSFHTACIAPSRNTEDMIQALLQLWFQWAGAPGELLIDAASEFNSDEFANFVQSHDIKVTTISAEAHFQNGKAERHGAVLEHMLSKFELEHELNTYKDVQQALWFCTQAKNSCGLRKGYAPVLGKQTRLPGAVVDCVNLPAHLLADSDHALGIRFKRQLAFRETARRAYHSADNDAALRRSVLRRSNPHRGSYCPGEWIMAWKQGNGALPGNWLGPMKVIVQEDCRTVWATMLSKLYRCAPEHIRPVTAAEAQTIVLSKEDSSASEITKHLGQIRGQGTVQAIDLTPTEEITPPPVQNHPPQDIPELENPESQEQNSNSNASELAQPDQEPGVEGVSSGNSLTEEVPDAFGEHSPPQAEEIPIPDDGDDELLEIGLWCQDVGPSRYTGDNPNSDEVWKCEFIVEDRDIQEWRTSDTPEAMSFLVSAARRQRAEVKLSQVSPSEQEEFRKAKEKEIGNWLKTNTVEKILRNKLSPEQILRRRWILTWKPLETEDIETKGSKTHKAKARLVVLGYLDPKITEIPRDAPTLGRHTRMLTLQLISSMSWKLQSFDISAAFLQGKTTGRPRHWVGTSAPSYPRLWVCPKMKYASSPKEHMV